MSLANLYTTPGTQPYTLSDARRAALSAYFEAWNAAQSEPRKALAKSEKAATNPERPAKVKPKVAGKSKAGESRVYLIQIQPSIDAAWVQAYDGNENGVESTTYRLDFEDGLWRCPCEAHARRGVCKHALGVEAVQVANRDEGYASQLVRLFVGGKQAPEILGEGPKALNQGG